MKILEIVNTQRKPLALVTWDSPGTLVIEADDSSVKVAINALISDLVKTGIPLRSGRTLERDDQKYLVEGGRLIQANDEEFLPALRSILYKYSVQGQRVFGILKESK